LAILTVLAFGLCGAWSQVPGDGGGQHDKAEDKQETANPPKPVVAVESPASANEQDYASEKSAKYPWKELLAPANIPNWFLVVVGAVTGWLVYKTLRAIKKQADIMETGAKDARESGAEATRIALATAKAAQKSADAANAQIQMMKDKERARISVSVSNEEFEADMFDSITIKITNDGTTSAFDVRAKGDVYGQPSENMPSMGNFITLDIPDVVRAASGPIATDVTFTTYVDLRGFEDSPIPYYFHLGGFIEYKDVFGESHKTTFRFRLQVNGVHPVPDTDRVKIRSFSGWRRYGLPAENLAT
jgi:hypothetical protein